MTAEHARELFASVLDAYRERAGRDPLRLVVHKTSDYTDDERTGIARALDSVPAVELLSLRSGDFRLVRQGSYPPHRGTACRLGDDRYLFTVGYMPAHLTYPGPHIPVPLEVLGGSDDFDGRRGGPPGALKDELELRKLVRGVPDQPFLRSQGRRRDGRDPARQQPAPVVPLLHVAPPTASAVE
jgi:hypothetical protein